MTRLLVLCAALVLLSSGAWATPTGFAVARTETPVLNTPDFRAVFGGADGRTLRTDACGQLRAMEFVALPGTVFRIEEELKIGSRLIYRVTTAEYPYPSKTGYFVDAEFVRMQQEEPPPRKSLLPARQEIVAALKNMEGSRYVWGGNRHRGVPALFEQYPPTGKPAIDPADREIWNLKGVDCSGLLYEATGGYTPRNTSALINFGTGVNIGGKRGAEIVQLLKPLDLIVWQGHVLIVIDGGNLIESRLVCSEPGKGVRIRPVSEALADIMKKRTPADSIGNGSREFVIRRWYPVL